jgi:pilus assembly protein CpaB
LTNKLALAVAIALGVLSILGIRSYVQNIQRQLEVTGAKGRYLTLVDDFPEGHKLTPDDVVAKDFQNETIQGALQGKEITETKLAEYLNRPMRVKTKAGQILSQDLFDTARVRVISPAKSLEGSERLVTVPVDPISSVANLIRPGDFVDMTATFPMPDRSGQVINMSFTVFKAKPVVATGSEIARNVLGTQGQYSSITLRVTAKEANRIIFCLHNSIPYQFTLLNQEKQQPPSSVPAIERHMTEPGLRDLGK